MPYSRLPMGAEMTMFRKMPPEFFDWLHWREGSPLDLFVVCRTDVLLASRRALRKHAVGWCRGENLGCRPKNNHKAVMFFKDGHHFWFHLTNHEFREIFNSNEQA
jgi:hypothetical protein